MPVIDLSSHSDAGTEPRVDFGVDVVAVHGLLEDSWETWTDAKTRSVWLRDLFPETKPRARVLLYGYDRKSFISTSSTSANCISSLATTLVEEICAYRECDDGPSQRPIIFICHGFGGLLVKKALVYSESARNAKLEYVRALFVSTFAIIFLATPHHGMTKRTAKIMSARENVDGLSRSFIDLLSGDSLPVSNTLGDILDDFSPLSDLFMIKNFWESQVTIEGKEKSYIVEETSAAPLNGVDRCGIDNTHAGMVKFGSITDPGYAIITSDLKRYIRDASKVIKLRWDRERKQIEMSYREQAARFTQAATRVSAGQCEAASLTDSHDKGFLNWRTDTGISSSGIFRPRYWPKELVNEYTGRSIELEGLVKGLDVVQSNTLETRPKILVVHGLGGAGKSELCRKYESENGHRFYGSFFIDASSSTSIETDFAKVATLVGKGGGWLNAIYHLSTAAKPWLLVFDNADERTLNLSQYLPKTGHGYVLITTRNQTTTIHANAGSFRLRGMARDDGINLLLRKAYPTQPLPQAGSTRWELADRIASRVEYLALALSHVAGTIHTKDITLDAYLRRFLSKRLKVLDLNTFSRSIDIDATAMWEIPLGCIQKEPSQDYRDARDLFYVFAFLHFASIPATIIRSAINRIEIYDSKEASSIRFQRRSTADEVKDRANAAMNLLANYALVELDTESRSCSLHPVVHEWALDRMSEADQEHWFEISIMVLSDCISSYMEAAQVSSRRELINHIDTCLYNYGDRFPQKPLPVSTVHCNALEKFAAVLAENGFWARAKVLQNKVIDYRTKFLGWRHEDTLRAQQGLGEIHWNLFEIKQAADVQFKILKARWWLRPSAKNWLQLMFPRHVAYCLALDDLTRTLWLANERELSRHTGEGAVAGLTKALGESDPRTLNAKFNLGRTYLHLGMLEASERLLRNVLEMREHFFGDRHLDVLMTKNELGVVLCAQHKDLVQAEHLVTEVLEARKEILGEEHAYTLWSVNDYSKILCETGRSEEAARILSDIIPIVKRTLGERHAGMFMTLGNLAQAYGHCRKWPQAKATLETIIRDIPVDFPDRPDSQIGLIKVLIHMEQYEEAEGECRTILESAERKSAVVSKSQLVTTLELLLKVYTKQGRAEDLSALQEQYGKYL